MMALHRPELLKRFPRLFLVTALLIVVGIGGYSGFQMHLKTKAIKHIRDHGGFVNERPASNFVLRALGIKQHDELIQSGSR